MRRIVTVKFINPDRTLKPKSYQFVGSDNFRIGEILYCPDYSSYMKVWDTTDIYDKVPIKFLKKTPKLHVDPEQNLSCYIVRSIDLLEEDKHLFEILSDPIKHLLTDFSRNELESLKIELVELPIPTCSIDKYKTMLHKELEKYLYKNL